ncbi:MAG: tetratricopeptide repeat protein [Candidatus Marinimicrobia bacterium]|nr:tetratricopeptide repeat protein [Candidatus Neomarinimicrobiota bacterium]
MSQENNAVPEKSLLEQVYQSRISLMQDSLFITRERLQAAEFLTSGVSRETAAVRDSLQLAQQTTRQWADSVTSLLVLADRQQVENSLNIDRLKSLSDSLTQSYIREQGLSDFNDSLLVLLSQTQDYLSSAAKDETVVSDSLQNLRAALWRLQSSMATNEASISTQMERLQASMMSQGGMSLDTLLENRNLSYLENLVDYRGPRSGIGRFWGGGGDVLAEFKQEELALYLAQARQEGRADDALNMLAELLISNKAPAQGALAYMKVLFLYPRGDAWTDARTKIVGLVERDSEEGRLLYEIALVPDSMQVGDDLFLRMLHYLDHLRSLNSEVALRWFVDECRSFMALYPGVVQTDQILFWMAQAYERLEEIHRASLTWQKLETLYPASSHLPLALLNLADIASNRLGLPEMGIERYKTFMERYPNHPRAPRALLSQAILYERELKDYHQAGELYRRLADEYPGDPIAPVGLFRYGVLLDDKLGSPAGATLVYEEILRQYGDDSDLGIPALEKLAHIAYDLDQYDGAIVYYLDIPERYPDADDKCVTAILEAAKIYENNLKNLDAAIHTLHMILDDYPDYPGIKSVQKRVQKLQKKRG